MFEKASLGTTVEHSLSIERPGGGGGGGGVQGPGSSHSCTRTAGNSCHIQYTQAEIAEKAFLLSVSLPSLAALVLFFHPLSLSLPLFFHILSVRQRQHFPVTPSICLSGFWPTLVIFLFSGSPPLVSLHTIISPSLCVCLFDWLHSPFLSNFPSMIIPLFVCLCLSYYLTHLYPSIHLPQCHLCHVFISLSRTR